MTDEYDPQDEMEAIHEQVGAWFDAFVDSPEFERLSQIEKDKSPDIVRAFTEHAFKHIGAAPEDWDPHVVAESCLEILPQKLSAGPAFFKAVAPVLSAFFEFLAAGEFLRNARDLSRAVSGLNDEILAASCDERNWGPAKVFVMAAQQAGVDVTDEAAMKRFIMEYNSRRAAWMEEPEEEPPPVPFSDAAPPVPFRHTEPRPGRNDPCPCGSGKKFKKCYGA